MHQLPTGAQVTGVVPAPDGASFVTTGRDGHAVLWDGEAGKPVRSLTSERGELVSAFGQTPSGRGITGDLDGGATIWDLMEGEPIVRLPCRSLPLTAVAMSADGVIAATGSLRGEVVVWDISHAIALRRVRVPSAVCSLALAPDGTWLLVGGEWGLTLYRVDDGHADPHQANEPGSADVIALLSTPSQVTALAVNPAMPEHALFGTAGGQVAYIRLPLTDRAG